MSGAAADKAAAGRSARAKGARGENEVARLIRDLTNWDVRRRVRNHNGDSDLTGVPGWCVEVKNHAKPSRGAVAHWWEQTVAQCIGGLPVLFFKAQPGDWRAVWPLAAVMEDLDAVSPYSLTVETSVEAWAMVAREMVPCSTLLEQNARSSEAVLAQEAA